MSLSVCVYSGELLQGRGESSLDFYSILQSFLYHRTLVRKPAGVSAHMGGAHRNTQGSTQGSTQEAHRESHIGAHTCTHRKIGHSRSRAYNTDSNCMCILELYVYLEFGYSCQTPPFISHISLHSCNQKGKCLCLVPTWRFHY